MHSVIAKYHPSNLLFTVISSWPVKSIASPLLCIFIVLVIFTPVLDASELKPLSEEEQKLYNDVITKTREEFLEPLKKKAMQGDSDAQVGMGGILIELGDLEEQNNDEAAAVDAYNEALAWFLQAAKQDNPAALYHMAMIYLTGKGVEKDPEAALKLLRISAKDYLDAQYLLGTLYSSDRDGVSKDLEEAAYWFEGPANEGYGKAQYMLGMIYTMPSGIAGKERLGFEWLEKAARQGVLPAQDGLARAYVSGSGVPRDFVSAYAWSNVAVASGYKKSEDVRSTLSKSMTVEQIAEAQKLSKELYAQIQVLNQGEENED